MKKQTNKQTNKKYLGKKCSMDIIDIQTIHQSLNPKIRFSSDISTFETKMIKQLICKLNQSKKLQERNLKIHQSLFNGALQRG